MPRLILKKIPVSFLSKLSGHAPSYALLLLVHTRRYMHTCKVRGEVEVMSKLPGILLPHDSRFARPPSFLSASVEQKRVG